jgi:hypothetical protein
LRAISFMRWTLNGALPAMVRAISMVSSRTLSAGTTLLTSPQCRVFHGGDDWLASVCDHLE